MISRLVHPHLEHAPRLHLLLEQWIVIFLEEFQELIRISPRCLVVVLDDKRLVRGGGRALRPTHHRINSEQDQQECESLHGDSPEFRFQIVHCRFQTAELSCALAMMSSKSEI